MIKFSPQFKAKFLQIALSILPVVLLVLDCVGVTVFYIGQFFGADHLLTAYQQAPVATIACSVIMLFLGLVSFVPAYIASYLPNLLPSKRYTLIVLLVVAYVGSFFAFIIPLLLS